MFNSNGIKLLKYLFDLPAGKRGEIFEVYCKWFLENDPIYSAQLRKVWLWKDWPNNWGRDKGIDLIAETYTGEFWAIQAKCYDESYYVTKEDVDKFLSESSRAVISYRLLICTTDRLGDNAREVIAGQEKQIGICALENLLDSTLEWPVPVENLKPCAPRQPKTPRPHQQSAISAVLEGFKKHEKGQLHMACGTGKTLVGLWLAEQLKSQNTLVLVPSISLVSQLYQEWIANAANKFIPIFVCSDPTVKDRDQMITSLYELGFPATTDSKAILEYLSSTVGTPKVIFSTYHSSPVIKELCALDEDLKFDLIVADEGHRCAGPADSNFATVLETNAIRACYKLFMTATPKIFSDHVKTKARELEYDVLSMDDEAKFGPVFHTLPFSAAIALDLLCDYEVLISVMDDKTYREDAEKGRFVAIDGLESDARTVAAQLLISKAIKTYSLSRIITFHSRKKAAHEFIKTFPVALNLISEMQKPLMSFYETILGDMLQSKRRFIVKQFENLETGTAGILANVRCLSEGVDVPALDGVAFIDPKGSEIEIVQAVGRAIRKAPNKKKGLILLPVFIEANDDAEINLEESCFKPIWKVLKALRAHDDILAEELDNLRLELGRRTYKKPPKLNKITIDLPVSIDSAFSDSLRLKIVDKCSSANKEPLSVEVIISWINKYNEKYETNPTRTSGIIEFADGVFLGTTWNGVNAALIRGDRGLPGKFSLADLVERVLGIKNPKRFEALPEDVIADHVQKFINNHGRKPQATDGSIEGLKNVTWKNVDRRLREGSCGLPGGSSLSDFIEKRFGIRDQVKPPDIPREMIRYWIEGYLAKYNEKPTAKSGVIEFAEGIYKNLSWHSVDQALKGGKCRGSKKISLATYIQAEFQISNPKALPSFSEDMVISWIRKFMEENKRKPSHEDGIISYAEGEFKDTTWSILNDCIFSGRRGFDNCFSGLAHFIEIKIGIRSRNSSSLPNETHIRSWIQQYFKKYKRWPSTKTGKVEFATGIYEGITWNRINNIFLPGSLAKYTSQHFTNNYLSC